MRPRHLGFLLAMVVLAMPATAAPARAPPTAAHANEYTPEDPRDPWTESEPARPARIEIYGRTTLDQINSSLNDLAKELGVDLIFMQSNSEGVIVDAFNNTSTTWMER